MIYPEITNFQRQAIISIFDEAEAHGISLWLESGWAIDARLGQITRTHEDIDIAYAHEHERSYIHLLTRLGFSNFRRLDYGFLMERDSVLIDSEPCFYREGEYNFPDFPKGTCPAEAEGTLFGRKFRCLSWAGMRHEFLGYENEVPRSNWREKDHESLRIIEHHLTLPDIKEGTIQTVTSAK